MVSKPMRKAAQAAQDFRFEFYVRYEVWLGRSTPGGVAIANERFLADKADFGSRWNIRGQQKTPVDSERSFN